MGIFNNTTEYGPSSSDLSFQGKPPELGEEIKGIKNAEMHPYQKKAVKKGFKILIVFIIWYFVATYFAGNQIKEQLDEVIPQTTTGNELGNIEQ